MMARNGILLAGKRVLFTIVIGILCSLSLSADYELTITNNDGIETKKCIKSYSFSNNLESIAKQNGVGQDIYSKEETLTNKVYLGKPVYRKVFTFDDYIVPVGSSGVNKYTDVISEDIDRIVNFDFDGYLNDGNDEILVSGNTSQNYSIFNSANTYHISADYRKSNNKIGVYLKNNIALSNSWKVSDLRVTVEYTKITDSVSTSQNKFKSYFHYILSSSQTDELISIDLKDTGVRFKEGYTYDSSTNSCIKN
ncbi:hypothetical protein [Arcobacter sp.]|uniref:hypothetical protein n=1 Tax=unclassified Arcobacter TaxID=2593671 RepID=UPI003B000EB7|eukprot:TRINITY_DN3805_c0_g1_i1.p1 TRINITY_DN3805_c0_g1~~TRINITY_DN3805_c0_g1_i1.p1  ORF type:complete len:252 (-),score=-75.40 TRINITY_DN3805_c0_g1_i1:310-1065(-)